MPAAALIHGTLPAGPMERCAAKTTSARYFGCEAARLVHIAPPAPIRSCGKLQRTVLAPAHDRPPHRQHPQFLDRRAYRPWQVDAGRPADPADRGARRARHEVEQVLDSMDIERERGITIKAQTVRLNYRAKDGKDYILNLMDTPGHVDFAYEVSRSLAACEGSLLVVDASQGVEAQTLANVYHALDAGHEIVPVLNKIDLPAAEPDRIKQQIEDVIGLDASEAVPISAKTGLGIDLVLEAIVTRLPPPKGDETAPLKALLVDSWYDAYLGVVVLVRVVDGVMRKGQRIRMIGTDARYEIDRIGDVPPQDAGGGATRPRRGRLHHRADQAGRRHARRRHDHRRQAPDRCRPARLQARAAGRVLRPLPRRRRRFRGSSRRDGETAAQRRELLLRDGELRRARLRFSLRLPRAAASGDHPGAARARVQSRPDRDRAVGRLQDRHDRRHGARTAQSRPTCPMS